MKKSILITLLLFITILAYGQEKEIQLNGIDSEIETLIKSYNTVGLSVTITKGNEVVYSKGFGYRNLEKKLPATDSTSFPVASVTKAFTASLLGILESKDSLSLKEKPAAYIPKLRFYNNEMDNLITIEDILSHKSGLGGHNGTLALFAEKNRLKTIEKLKYLKPSGKINDSYIYSNMGYTIAGTIVEQVSGKNWDKNIKEKIFRPLNMNNSFTNYQEMKNQNNYSLGYGLLNGELEEVRYEDYYNASPAGAIKSSSKDLGNWMMTWLNNGYFQEQQVLPKDYVYDATTIHNIIPKKRESYSFLYGAGFGWQMETRNGHYKVFHGGNTSGFTSLVILYPFKKLGITILSNQQNSTLPYIIADVITNRMLNLPKMEITEYPVLVSDIYPYNKETKGLNKEKKTTHKLSEFCGKYSRKGYGTFEVINQNNSLFVVFPTFKFMLEHIHYNRFKLKSIKKISQVINPEFFELNFLINYKGEIHSTEINLETEPVEFIRQISK